MGGCVLCSVHRKEDVNRAMCKDREVRFEIFNERIHAYQPLPSNSVCVFFFRGEKSFLL